MKNYCCTENHRQILIIIIIANEVIVLFSRVLSLKPSLYSILYHIIMTIYTSVSGFSHK